MSTGDNLEVAASPQVREKQHAVVSPSTERDQIAGREPENTSRVALDDKVALQRQLEAQSVEFNNIRNQLDQIKAFLNISDGPVADRVAGAFGEKEKQIEGLRRHLSVVAPPSNGIHKPREALPRKKDNARSDEVEVKASECQPTIQVGEPGATDADKIQQLQLELFTATAKLIELQDSHATQSQNLLSVKDELLAMTLSNQDKDRIISSLTAERDQQASANATKAEQITKLQQKLSYSESQFTELRDRYEVLMGELSAVSSKLQTSVTSSEDKDRQVTVLADEITRLKSDLSGILSRLRDVQRIVSTADLYADETIVSMLNRLNAEVQQNTTYMAEVMAKDFQPRAKKETKEQASATQNVSDSIGKTLSRCLAGVKRDDVELYLPIAFQAYFSYYLRYIISSWTIEKVNSHFIDEIYEQLQQTEAQAMSGRWRALTRTYIPSSWIKNPSSLTERIVTELSDVVVAAGCAASTAAASSKLLSFRDKVLSIISIAGQLSEMIGKVVSADFTVTAPQPHVMFAENTMEQDVDDYDKDPKKANGTAANQNVLCSTYLGMTKRIQRELGRKETLTVIKAKVVLESFLDG